MKITMNQTSEDFLIYCSDDNNITMNLKTQARCLPFSIKENQEQGAYLNNEKIEININQESFNMNIQQLALQGKHNIYNSMAAAISARILDLNKDLIRESLVTSKM